KPVRVRDVTGTWFQAAFNPLRNGFELRRLAITSQTGVTLRGELSSSGASNAPTPVIGTLEAERTITLTITGEPEITGTVPRDVFAQGAIFSLSGFAATEGALMFHPI